MDNPVTYQELLIFRKELLKTKIEENSYDLGVKNTEAIFDERLRNKLSPIVNLIELVKHKDFFLDDKYTEIININIKSANQAVKEILNIKEY